MTGRAVSVARALGVRLGDQFAGGEFGAFGIQTGTGAPGVLKLLPAWPELALSKVRSAAALVDLLISRGYPAPRFLDVGQVGGTVYTVQEYVDGLVCVNLPGATFAELLQLWRRQQGLLPSGAGTNWGIDLIARANRGEELRAKTKDTRALAVLDRALEAAHAADPTIFRTIDVVHGDYHPGNVLVRGGQVAAVIDWETAQAGDSRADLLRMYAVAATWQEPGSAVVDLYRHELDATTPPEIWRPMAAELTVHHLRYGLLAKPSQLDWVLREADILLPPIRW